MKAERNFSSNCRFLSFAVLVLHEILMCHFFDTGKEKPTTEVIAIYKGHP